MFTADVIGREMCTPSVSNVIYHKFSHGAISYTLNGENVNVMLEYFFVLFFCTFSDSDLYLYKVS